MMASEETTDVLHDTTALRLCQSLITYLEGGPNLDNVAKKILVDARVAIDSALLLARRADTADGVVESSKSLVGREPTVVVKSRRRAAITQIQDAFKGFQRPRQKKKRALVAVYPYSELSEELSNTTVM